MEHKKKQRNSIERGEIMKCYKHPRLNAIGIFEDMSIDRLYRTHAIVGYLNCCIECYEKLKKEAP